MTVENVILINDFCKDNKINFLDVIESFKKIFINFVILDKNQKIHFLMNDIWDTLNEQEKESLKKQIINNKIGKNFINKDVDLKLHVFNCLDLNNLNELKKIKKDIKDIINDYFHSKRGKIIDFKMIKYIDKEFKIDLWNYDIETMYLKKNDYLEYINYLLENKNKIKNYDKHIDGILRGFDNFDDIRHVSQ